jgi:hypothetical protein
MFKWLLSYKSTQILFALAAVAYGFEGNTTMAALLIGISLLIQIANGNQLKKSTRPKSTRRRTAQRKQSAK